MSEHFSEHLTEADRQLFAESGIAPTTFFVDAADNVRWETIAAEYPNTSEILRLADATITKHGEYVQRFYDDTDKQEFLLIGCYGTSQYVDTLILERSWHYSKSLRWCDNKMPAMTAPITKRGRIFRGLTLDAVRFAGRIDGDITHRTRLGISEYQQATLIPTDLPEALDYEARQEFDNLPQEFQRLLQHGSPESHYRQEKVFLMEHQL